MSEKRILGKGLDIPAGARLSQCEDCGELLFAIKLSGGDREILVQPVVVRGLIPDVELIQGVVPSSAEELIQKLIGRTALARFSPPAMIPHTLVCIRAPLIRSLPAPMRNAPPGPEPKPSGPVAVKPNGDPSAN